MWQAILLGVLAGLLGANAFPHFVKGITRQPFPTVFGSAPWVNLLAGWTGLMLAGVSLWGAHPINEPGWTLLGLAIGSLPMALFHATRHTFGRE